MNLMDGFVFTGGAAFTVIGAYGLLKVTEVVQWPAGYSISSDGGIVSGFLFVVGLGIMALSANEIRRDFINWYKDKQR